MKNKQVTITADQINNSGLITIDATMKVYQNTINYGVTERTLYPKELQIINESGANLEYNFFANDEEYSGYVKDPTDFTFISLPNNYFTQDDGVLNRCSTFVIQRVGDVATGNLRIDFINYVNFV
ncbi:MAG: hypothetical protein GY853_09890 [PVC group bacterium]|nr:hypothetical protein [PVC group bacterium]